MLWDRDRKWRVRGCVLWDRDRKWQVRGCALWDRQKVAGQRLCVVGQRQKVAGQRLCVVGQRQKVAGQKLCVVRQKVAHRLPAAAPQASVRALLVDCGHDNTSSPTLPFTGSATRRLAHAADR